jgi:hypothetical protein
MKYTKILMIKNNLWPPKGTNVERGMTNKGDKPIQGICMYKYHSESPSIIIINKQKCLL